MSHEPHIDWDPTSPAVQGDQRAAYDAMRERCPVAHSELVHRPGWRCQRRKDGSELHVHDPA